MKKSASTMSLQMEYVRVPACKQISARVDEILRFQFHEAFSEASITTNGLYFTNTYLPEEVVVNILSYVNIKDVLNCSLVCKKWCNIIKSQSFWAPKYCRKFNKKAKKLPWYLFYCLFSSNYFDVNLIKNGNGQEQLTHWKPCGRLEQEDTGVEIEDPPIGTDPLPDNVPEFNGCTSCFANSGEKVSKQQEISFGNNQLMIYVMNRYKPHIYLSEWIAGQWVPLTYTRYYLKCILRDDVRPLSLSEAYDDMIFCRLLRNYDSITNFCCSKGALVNHMKDRKWAQVKILLKNYPDGCISLLYRHHWSTLGEDSYFKVAGSNLKILFDSIDGKQNDPEDCSLRWTSGVKKTKLLTYS